MLPLNKKLFYFFLLIILLISLSSTLVSAQQCETAIVKNALRKALFSYFGNPSQSSLTLTELRDLLNFYVSVPENQLQVNCAGSGSESGVQMEALVDRALVIIVQVPVCADGTEYGLCSTTLPQYCYNGQLIPNCAKCLCPANMVCGSDGRLCSAMANASCGNGVCGLGESCVSNNTTNSTSCLADCGSCPAPAPSCGNGACGSGESCVLNNTTNSTSCLADCGNCPASNCGNGLCGLGESCVLNNTTNSTSCLVDCGNCPASNCGNGLCGLGESCVLNNTTNSTSCLSDCGNCPVSSCGNSVCGSGESCVFNNTINSTSCSVDCGNCPPSCTETDGGQNYNVSGTVTDRNIYSGQISTKTDYCLSSATVQEFYCRSSGPDATGNSSVGVSYTCPSLICSSGACLSGTCGNGLCSFGESCVRNNTTNSTSCLADCGNCPVSSCGNGICGSGESCVRNNITNSTSCQSDCGSCPTSFTREGIDGTWCYDADPDNDRTIRSYCQDQNGVYYDYCGPSIVWDYYCGGTWNGNAFTNVYCDDGGVSCSNCNNGVCS